MKKRHWIASVLVLWMPLSAWAHRLDEYLQATLLSLSPHHLEGSMRLVTGVAVAQTVLAGIDTNGDGVISAAEQAAYASRVLRECSLEVDGKSLPLHLDAVKFPSPESMRAGMGEIDLQFSSDLPPGGPKRHLTFENHHQSRISVYLVNALVPADNKIQIDAQSRSITQSVYSLDFTDGSGTAGSPRLLSFSGFAGAFHLGMRHIAEGTDHLLFLLTLLLPAPLLAVAGRWSKPATVQRSLVQILRIVTAFTVGHSLTLALSVFGWVRLPGRPVEVLVAFSILVSAIHALRPLFPGKEAAIAAFFGLIHGLAFASALDGLGVTGWYRLVSLLGFNLGIESMQLGVVAVTFPSLLLLSRTRFYSDFRIGGAIFAGAASICWTLERSFQINNPVGRLVDDVAHHGVALAAFLTLVSAVAWIHQTMLTRKQRLGSLEQEATETAHI